MGLGGSGAQASASLKSFVQFSDGGGLRASAAVTADASFDMGDLFGLICDLGSSLSGASSCLWNFDTFGTSLEVGVVAAIDVQDTTFAVHVGTNNRPIVVPLLAPWPRIWCEERNLLDSYHAGCIPQDILGIACGLPGFLSGKRRDVCFAIDAQVVGQVTAQADFDLVADTQTNAVSLEASWRVSFELMGGPRELFGAMRSSQCGRTSIPAGQPPTFEVLLDSGIPRNYQFSFLGVVDIPFTIPCELTTICVSWTIGRMPGFCSCRQRGGVNAQCPQGPHTTWITLEMPTV
jgi:hypothetical protein